MNLRYAKPAREGRKPRKTGTLKIEAVNIVLTDATTIAVVRGPHGYRVTAHTPGSPKEDDVGWGVPEMGAGVSNFLDELPLESRARATLFTLFSLESLKCDT